MKNRQRCGRKLYDDYVEFQPGALDNLKTILSSSSGGHPVTLQPEDFDPPAINDRPERENTWLNLVSRCKQLMNGSPRDTRLPWTRRGADSMELGICQEGTGNPRVGHNFVLLCLPFMRWGRKLHQLDTCSLQSDQQLFLLLRRKWADLRKSRQRISTESLRRLVSLEFVMVGLADPNFCIILPWYFILGLLT